MRQWTTPINTFDVDIDLTECEVIFLTYTQHDETVFEKTKEDMTITENTVTVRLTQEETGLLDPSVEVEMQFRVKYADEFAPASNIMCTDVEKVLKQGEI